MSVSVTFIMRDGVAHAFHAEVGQTLLDVARANKINEIEGACGGAMACSTCHVIVDASWYGKLPVPTEDETDMLDLAPGITKTSRLGCQIKLTEAMNGLVVKLPSETHSLLS